MLEFRPMRWSRLFIPTLRENPAEAEVPSHRLLLRAGYVRQLSAGIYSYLFLAQRSLLKIQQIVRQEMNAIGGQEMYLPALNPAEVWQESGRWDADDVPPWEPLAGPPVRALRYRQYKRDGTVVQAEWITNFSIAKLGSLSFYRMAKSRWEIENGGLQRWQKPLRHGAY